VAGADGNLCFADQGTTHAIGRINPTTHAINEFSAGMNPGNNPYGIAAGADGNLWFSDSVCPGAAIGRVTPAGAINEFSAGLNAGSCPYFIAAGSDGSSWFTDEGTPTPAIGRITPAASISEFSAGLNAGTTPYGIAGGPDGNVWFTDNGTPNAIGRITTPPAVVTGDAVVLGSGAATVAGMVNGHAQPTSDRFEFGPTPGYGSSTALVGAGTASTNVPASATLTGLLPSTTYHYRLDATNPTDNTAGGDATFTTLALPTVGPVIVNPKTWRRGSKLAQISKKRKRPPVGTKISFSLSRAAVVQLAFLSPRPGRRIKKRCVSPTRKNRKARKCTRLVLAGTLSFAGHAGKNTIRFQGRVSRTRKLTPGGYQLRVTATDPTTPINSPSGTAKFTIVKG
jgi:hypothetical protein